MASKSRAREFYPRKMLVTGSAGFIGSNFVTEELKRNSSLFIVSIDKLTYAADLNNLSEVRDCNRHLFIEGDVCDADLICFLLKKYQIDTIVHFAAESHVDNSIKEPAVFVKTNVQGTFTLLESARDYWLGQKRWDRSDCRFHHISTDEVFGSLEETDPPFTEMTPYQPRSPYSASKAASDHLAMSYHHTYGLPVTISNCSNNFGPRQHAEKLIPTIIHSCLTESPIPIYGTGANIRDWLFVTDHCDAIDLILSRGAVGENYNIGGGNEWDNLSLAYKICAITDELVPRSLGTYRDLVHFVSDRPGHDFRYAIDAGKIRDKLGWMPSNDFTSKLESTIKWYLNTWHALADRSSQAIR